jgi:hypothetical protein
MPNGRGYQGSDQPKRKSRLSLQSNHGHCWLESQNQDENFRAVSVPSVPQDPHQNFVLECVVGPGFFMWWTAPSQNGVFWYQTIFDSGIAAPEPQTLAHPNVNSTNDGRLLFPANPFLGLSAWPPSLRMKEEQRCDSRRAIPAATLTEAPNSSVPLPDLHSKFYLEQTDPWRRMIRRQQGP